MARTLGYAGERALAMERCWRKLVQLRKAAPDDNMSAYLENVPDGDLRGLLVAALADVELRERVGAVDFSG